MCVSIVSIYVSIVSILRTILTILTYNTYNTYVYTYNTYVLTYDAYAHTYFPSLLGLKKHVISLIRPECKSIFGLHDPLGLRYIFQLRLGLSPLRSHKKHHNFAVTPSDKCLCKQGIESTRHYLLSCPYYETHRTVLLNQVNDILLRNNINFPENQTTNLYLYGHHSLNSSDNRKILSSTVAYINSTGRFAP